MAVRHNRLKKQIILIFILTAAILLPGLSSPLEARKPIRWRAKKTVVIDPGHGGHETGARGVGGLLEKDVTLETARRIESILKNRFKVQLTRTDDYAVAILRRTDVANHLKADVFVSIHTGASFQHDARGMNIFFFQESSVASAGSPPDNGRWDRLQLKHVEKSKKLAQTLCRRLQEAVPTAACEVAPAPLLVLRGADMPSVLVEVGTLTNPEDEKQLNGDENLTLLGKAIADGIYDFLRQPAGSAGQ
jgi:N-acetylmuramoyl-L-alanine amidase